MVFWNPRSVLPGCYSSTSRDRRRGLIGPPISYRLEELGAEVALQPLLRLSARNRGQGTQAKLKARAGQGLQGHPGSFIWRSSESVHHPPPDHGLPSSRKSRQRSGDYCPMLEVLVHEASGLPDTFFFFHFPLLSFFVLANLYRSCDQ